MKKALETAAKTAGIVFTAAFAVFCAARAGAASEAASRGVERCLGIIVPSLFSMLVAAELLSRTGLSSRAPSFLVRAAGRFLGMRGNAFPIFLFSQIAGYPAGAAMLAAEYRAGRLPKRSAELLSGVCFGAGPAFVFGCLSERLWGDPAAGKLVLLSTLSANAVLAIAISFPLRRERARAPKRPPLDLSGRIFTESVAAGGRAIAGICFSVVVFSVITEMLDELGAVSAAAKAISSATGFGGTAGRGLAYSLLDVTAAAELPKSCPELLPAVCALVSFGGICVHLQILSATRGELSAAPFLVMRTAAAALSFIFCKLLAPLFPLENAVPASAGFAAFREGSAPPSAALLFAVIILIYDLGGRNEKKFSE